MSYHSTVFTNKEFKRLLSKENLSCLQLMWVKGRPAKTKGMISWKGDVVTVFGSSFVAKLRRFQHRVIK